VTPQPAYAHLADVGSRVGNYIFKRAARIYPAVWVMPLLVGGLYVTGFGGVTKADTNRITTTASLAVVQATRASAFDSSVGVNTHLSWWDSAWGAGNGQWAGAESKVQAELAYLGITLVRDGVPDSAAVAAEYGTLAQAGIDFDMLQTETNGTVALDSDITALAIFERVHPGAIFAYEGANEYNINDYLLKGRNSRGDLAWGALDAQTIQQAVAANPTLAAANIQLVAPSVAKVHSGTGLGQYVTKSNWHVYDGVGQQLQSNIVSGIAFARATAPGKPVVITEAGISSASLSTANWGVTGNETIQGLIDLNAVLDGYAAGAEKTFLYELMDNKAASDQEDNFGLFKADGTPKMAARYLHNLLAILADTGSHAASFSPGRHAVGLSGLPATASSMLLEKSFGTFELVLWNGNATLMNATSGEVETPPTGNIIARLGATYQTVKVYDPVRGTGSIRTLHNVDSVTLALSADPLIVEIPRNFGGTH